MPHWIQHHVNSFEAQLAATALLSGIAVASAILGYQNTKRKEAVEDLKSSIPEIDERHYAEKVSRLAAFFSTRQSKLGLLRRLTVD